MGHLDHAAFGRLTPVLSYAMACIGAASGCAARCVPSAPPDAPGATGSRRPPPHSAPTRAERGGRAYTPEDPEVDGGPPPPVRGRRAHAGPADERPEETPATTPAESAPGRTGRTGHAGRPRLWPRTVRAKVVCLLMVPVVSLLALWGHATVTTVQDVSRLRQAERPDTRLRAPVAAVLALQTERAEAVRCTTAPSDGCADDLRTPTERTDRTVTALRLGDRHTVAQSEELPAEVARRLETFVTSAAQLHTLRAETLARRTGWDTAHARYTAAVFAAFGVDALTRVQDAGRGTDARVLLESLRAADALAQEDTVLTGAPHRRTARRTAAAALHRRRTVTDTAAEDPMSLVESAGRMHTARLLKSVG
ncbi:hypothetical protein GCM10020256_68130 [Streptomyces thermocoprophilus]